MSFFTNLILGESSLDKGCREHLLSRLSHVLLVFSFYCQSLLVRSCQTQLWLEIPPICPHKIHFLVLVSRFFHLRRKMKPVLWYKHKCYWSARVFHTYSLAAIQWVVSTAASQQEGPGLNLRLPPRPQKHVREILLPAPSTKALECQSVGELVTCQIHTAPSAATNAF